MGRQGYKVKSNIQGGVGCGSNRRTSGGGGGGGGG